jgi:hypothetical protein
MIELVGYADIELEIKIQYIIEGISHKQMNKTILCNVQN